MPIAPIDIAPIVLSFAGLVAAFTSFVFWYMRKTFTKQEQMLDKSLTHGHQLQNELTIEKAKNATLTERERQMDRDIKQLQREIRQLQDDMADYRQQRTKEQETYKQRALEYQNQIIERDKQIKALQDERDKRIKALHDEIEGFKKRLDDVNKRLNTLNTDYVQVVSERDRLREEKATMEKEKTDMKAEMTALTNHNMEMDEKMRKMQADLDMVKAQNAPSALDVAPRTNDGYELNLNAHRKRETDQIKMVEPEDEL